MRLSPPGAAFLDRDGTINVKAPEGEYIERPEELELLPGAAQAVKALNDARVPVVVVTNQRGIALGRMTESDLVKVHARLAEMLEQAAGAHLDLVLHCPHQHDECDCRKPKPGMFFRAVERMPSIVLERSIMVGDSVSDIEAGRRAGVPAFLLGSEEGDLARVVARALEA